MKTTSTSSKISFRSFSIRLKNDFVISIPLLLLAFLFQMRNCTGNSFAKMIEINNIKLAALKDWNRWKRQKSNFLDYFFFSSFFWALSSISRNYFARKLYALALISHCIFLSAIHLFLYHWLEQRFNWCFFFWLFKCNIYLV